MKLVVADLSWKACVCTKGLCPLHGIMETYFYAYALCKYKCYAHKAFLRFKDCWKYSEGGYSSSYYLLTHTSTVHLGCFGFI